MVSHPVIEALSATLEELLACCEFLAIDRQAFAVTAGRNQGVAHRGESLKRRLFELNAMVALAQGDSGLESDKDAAFNQLEALLDEFNLVVATFERSRQNAEAEAAAPDGMKLVSQKTRRTYFQMKAAMSAQSARVG